MLVNDINEIDSTLRSAIEDTEDTSESKTVTIKSVHIMSIPLKYSQSITITLIKEIDTNDNIYISVCNITNKEIKSVELYLDNQFITKDTCISKYTSGILSIDNVEKLFNASDLRILISYLDNNTVDVIVTSSSLKDITNRIK